MVAAVLHLDEGAGAAVEPVDQMAGGLVHRHDVVDADTGVLAQAEIVAPRLELLGIAEDEVDLGHGGEGFRVDLGGAAGDDDAGVRIVAARLADRLAGLAHGLGRHRAGVDQDGVAHAGLLGAAAHDLGFQRVQPAAEGDGLRFAHGRGPKVLTSTRSASPTDPSIRSG